MGWWSDDGILRESPIKGPPVSLYTKENPQTTHWREVSDRQVEKLRCENGQ
jgi:hypothetical protein